ncbi:MAG TPA: hypothetical protein VF173_21665 [Thermoanaerobaculia bacterium]|nr:hypothetical protein [Thermoanaerobaculia bacterium]
MAIERLAKQLPLKEVEVLTVEPDTGRLSGKTISPGQRPYPVAFTAEATSNGTRVSMLISLPAGAFGLSGMKESLCQMVALAKSDGAGAETRKSATKGTPPASEETPQESTTKQDGPQESASLNKAVPPEYLQNNSIANRLISLSTGAVYLLHQNTLLRMTSDEADVWQRVAEDVKSAAIDPQDGKVIYAATLKDTVIKSLDGGTKWLEISNGLPRSSISMILINPSNPQEIFAGTGQGLYRTRDAGFSWEATPLSAPVSQYFVNPKSPEHEYALTTTGLPMVSSDSGTTWRQSDAGLPTELLRGGGRTAKKVVVKVTELFFVGQGKTYLLAETAGKGLYRSEDHGTTWKAVTAGLNLGARFKSIYVGEGEVVLAGSELARSADGITWTPISVKTIRMKPGFFEGVAQHPRREGFLVLFRYTQDAETANRIGYIGKGGALIGLSYGPMPRSSVFAIWTGRLGERPAIFATISNSTPTRYSSRYDLEGGTYFSIDDGYSWEFLFSSDCGHEIATRANSEKDTWLFGAPHACMLKLKDDGLAWSRPQGLLFGALNDSVNKIAFDPVDKSLLYYSAGVNDYHIYRYKYDANGNGQAVDLKVLAADVVVSEDKPKMIYAGVGQLSTDGGWTWLDKSAALARYIEPNRAKSYRRPDFTLLAFRGNEIRIAIHRYDTYLHSGGFSILKSGNLGESWDIASSFPGERLTGIFVDPNDSTHMFAISERFGKRGNARENSVEVKETKDWGGTWKTIFVHRLASDDENREGDSVAAVYGLSGVRSIFVGGRIGLWKSENGGESWRQIGGAQ